MTSTASCTTRTARDAGGTINAPACSPNEPCRARRTTTVTTSYRLTRPTSRAPVPTTHRADARPPSARAPSRRAASRYEPNTKATQGYAPGFGDRRRPGQRRAGGTGGVSGGKRPGRRHRSSGQRRRGRQDLGQQCGCGRRRRRRQRRRRSRPPDGRAHQHARTRRAHRQPVRHSPRPGQRYLIETDPRFANYRNWLASDYLLDKLGLDPDLHAKAPGRRLLRTAPHPRAGRPAHRLPLSRRLRQRRRPVRRAHERRRHLRPAVRPEARHRAHRRADGAAHQRHRLAGRADRHAARRQHPARARAAALRARAPGRHRRLGRTCSAPMPP